MTARHLSTAFKVAEAVLRPPLSTLTRRDWQGGENLPRDRGFVAASNHLSYADPFTLAHFLLDHGCPPRFLAKDAVFRIPVAGRVIAGAGQIPVYRETSDAGRALVAAVAAVRAGECVAVYPEGTLTRDPGLWPMVGKTGAARIALTTGCPVIPVAQWGAHRLIAPYGKLPRVLWRPRLVHVWAGPEVDLTPWRGRAIDADVLAGATEAVLAAITRLLERIRGEVAPPRRWDPREHGQQRLGPFRRGAGTGHTTGEVPVADEDGVR